VSRPNTLLVVAVQFTACGFDAGRGDRFESSEIWLPVQSPVESARLTTFGFPNEDMRQEIWVKLEAGADISDVFDTSVFAPLRPGVTDVEAIGMLGEPDSHLLDGCGEKWLKFKMPSSTLVVGCDHDTGFLPISSFCSWTLYAELGADQPVVTSAAQAFIDHARSSPVTVARRTMHVQTADYSAGVSYFFDLADAGATATWRHGEPPTRRAFCFGG
jgi:hypothetical protein